MRTLQAGIPWLARGWDDPKPKPERMLTHDFPLRPGLLVRCTLPVNLTRADADRIIGFVRTLAFADVPTQIELIPLHPKGS